MRQVARLFIHPTLLISAPLASQHNMSISVISTDQWLCANTTNTPLNAASRYTLNVHSDAPLLVLLEDVVEIWESLPRLNKAVSEP